MTTDIDIAMAKTFAKIFFDGVSVVNSGSDRKFVDGLEYLEKRGNYVLVAEYKKLMPKRTDEDKKNKKNGDEDEE